MPTKPAEKKLGGVGDVLAKRIAHVKPVAAPTKTIDKKDEEGWDDEEELITPTPAPAPVSKATPVPTSTLRPEKEPHLDVNGMSILMEIFDTDATYKDLFKKVIKQLKRKIPLDNKERDALLVTYKPYIVFLENKESKSSLQTGELRFLEAYRVEQKRRHEEVLKQEKEEKKRQETLLKETLKSRRGAVSDDEDDKDDWDD
jgi:hypothetical protein